MTATADTTPYSTANGAAASPRPASATVAERAHPATASRQRHLRTVVDRDALVDVVPLMLALIPFSAVIGVQAANDGRAGDSLAGTLLLFAGSAQVSALSLQHQGAGIAAILGTVALINARFLAYSAALAPRFARQPLWFRVLGCHFIVDQTYAIAAARVELTSPARFRRYWLTSGAAVALVWVAGMAAGATLGPVIPRVPALTLLPAAMFAAFLGPKLTDRPGRVAAAAGVAAAVIPAPVGLRVLLGTAAGALAGFLTAKARRR